MKFVYLIKKRLLFFWVLFCVHIMIFYSGYANQNDNSHNSKKRYALIIGIGDYPRESGLLSLSADDDTEKLQEILESQGWIVILMNKNQTEFYQPTYDNIMRILGLKWNNHLKIAEPIKSTKFAGIFNTRPDDLIMFFYGGHGISKEGLDCILPVDIQVNESGEIIYKEKLIPIEAIKEGLRQLPSNDIFMFTDACRYPTVVRSTDKAPLLSPWNVRSASEIDPVTATTKYSQYSQTFYMFFSASNRQFSHERQDVGEGVFTSYLLKIFQNLDAKRDADKNQDKMISTEELGDYLKLNTKNYIESLPASQRRSYQVPVYWAEGGNMGNYYFFNFAKNENLNVSNKPKIVDPEREKRLTSDSIRHYAVFNLDYDEVRARIHKLGLYDYVANPSAQGIYNRLEKLDRQHTAWEFNGNSFDYSGPAVLRDRSTNLYWQDHLRFAKKSYSEIKEYVYSLNRNGIGIIFRLPTLEEAMTILEPFHIGGIDPKFSLGHATIWTCDMLNEEQAWVVDFSNCYCHPVSIKDDSTYYVMAVCRR